MDVDIKNEVIEKFGDGLYRLFWEDGSSSLAAVGHFKNGDRWFTPTDWVVETKSTDWHLIHNVEVIANR